jgi:hypothetical protein
MRFVALAAGLFVAAAVSAPADAAWKDHAFPELGLGKEFPGDPKREEAEYKTPVAGTAKATVLSMTDNNIVYRVTVVDLKHKVDVGASIMGECVFLAEDEGTPIANMATRVEPGAKAVYGRLVTVELEGNKGRKQTGCYFTQGRLYRIEATVLPEHGQPNSPQVIRFTNSLRFDLEEDWSKVEDNLNAAAGGR